MDINSLLSPQTQPPRNAPSTAPSSSHHHYQHQTHNHVKRKYRPDGRRAASSLSNEVTLSPPADPPRSTPAEDVRYNSSMGAIPEVRTPLDDARSSSRSPFGTPNTQPSRNSSLTPLMAHQDVARSSPAIANARSGPPTLQRAYSASDLILSEAPAQIPVPRAYSTSSLTTEDLETVTEMTSNLAKNSYDYTSHVHLINMLHRGFNSHISGPEEGVPAVDPADYALLADLRQAREAMDSRFAVGESIWRDWIHDESRLAKLSEERNAVMELCARAVQEEPTSIILWSLYGEWVWSTFALANDVEDSGHVATVVVTPTPMSPDDKLICKEIFTRDLVLSVWRHAVSATRWRVDQSHVIWNRYAQIVMQDFPDHPPRQALEEGRSLYMMRLQVPHAAWEDTLQTMLYPYVNKHYPDEWSDIIAATKDQAEPAKRAYALRESYEDDVEAALESQEELAMYKTFADYLAFEARHKKKPTPFDVDLRCALFERALLHFPTMTEWWMDYIEFRIATHQGRSPVLPLLERSTRHCPWSGDLWARRMLQAEIEGAPHNEIESINIKASNSGLLEVGGVTEMLNVQARWCNYLRRGAFGPNSTDEAFDMAEGIPQVIEGVQATIKRFLGEEYQGDPHWRLERIYIEFLTRARRLRDVRDLWKSLIPAHCHSYDFWTRYYHWEMNAWASERAMEGAHADTSADGPALASEVVKLAFAQDNIDWPEKIYEIYAYHHYAHHSAEDIQHAEIDLRAAKKHLNKRRDHEAAAAHEAAQLQGQAPVTSVEHINAAKRKREVEGDVDELDQTEDAVKRSKVDGDAESVREGSVPGTVKAKRDREHSTASVRGLPPDVTELQIRKFFRDCGNVRSISVQSEPNGASASCTIEFETHEDVLTARTQDGKSLDGFRVRVGSGAMSTLYVTNYPPAYDEDKVRSLFGSYGEIVSVRFPSLKYNSRRRFCYVQFLTNEAARAATEMDGKAIDGQHTLLAKISDPDAKKSRSGATAEGREVHASNLHFSSTEQDIRDLFQDCGTIENVKMIRGANGKFRGSAFVVFATADEIAKALALDQKPYKERVVNVRLATDKAAREANNMGQKPATHVVQGVAPAGDGKDIHMTTDDAVHDATSETSRTKRERTVAMVGVPDTVNDARIRSFFEEYGPLVKFTVHRDKNNVLAEFVNLADAGKVGMGVDCTPIGPDCHIVDPGEVFGRAAVDKKKPTMGQITAMRPAQARGHRPAQRGGPVRRGGGLGFRKAGDETKQGPAKTNGDDGGKSNSDFRNIFAQSSTGGGA